MNKKVVTVSLVGMVVIGLIVSLWLYRYMSQRPISLAVAAERGTIHAVVSADGKVVPEESAQLGFEQNGRIIELPYAVGDSVKQGAVLALEDLASAVAELRQAQALSKSASANLDQYEALVKMQKAKLDSLKKTATANSADKNAQKKQIDASEAQVDAQKAQVIAAQAGVDVARAELRKTSITAPFDGIITRQDVKVGEIATPGETIVTVASPDAFKLEMLVSQNNIGRIHVGDVAQIFIEAIPGQVLAARVTAIDPTEAMEGSVSQYRVALHFADAVPAVRSGMDVSAEIVVNR